MNDTEKQQLIELTVWKVAMWLSKRWMGATRGRLIYEISVKERELLEQGVIPD